MLPRNFFNAKSNHISLYDYFNKSSTATLCCKLQPVKMNGFMFFKSDPTVLIHCLPGIPDTRWGSRLSSLSVLLTKWSMRLFYQQRINRAYSPESCRFWQMHGKFWVCHHGSDHTIYHRLCETTCAATMLRRLEPPKERVEPETLGVTAIIEPSPLD